MQKIVSIVGLTASGKTALGIKIAKQFNGEIISADSRQVYRGLDIGSAKVTHEEMDGVPHHLLDVVDAGEKFDVFEFQRRAFDAIDDILRRGKLPIIVGGTGLYSRSIVENYAFKGEATGCRYHTCQVCLMPPREILRPLVGKRIDERLQHGMIEETRELLARGVDAKWLQSLGLDYYWNVELIQGRVTLTQYKENLTTKTMQFAKRQRTWFKREKNTVFLTDPKTFYQDTMKLISLFLT